MEKDKVLHFIAGIIVSLGATFIYYGITQSVNTFAGLSAGVLAGIGKELYDEYDYGGFDKYDMFATWAGTIISIGVVYLLFQF